MKGARFHAALLIVASIFAFQTWNRADPSPGDPRQITVWQYDTTQVLSVGYETPEKELKIERRVDGQGAYFWGSEVLKGQGTEPATFPIGASGHSLVAQLARLRVTRDLGPLPADSLGTFGLLGALEHLTVELEGQTKQLSLGDDTYGGEGRYAWDEEARAVYVIPRTLISPLEIGKEALRERLLHRFPPQDVDRVQIRLPSRGLVRTMARMPSGEWRSIDRDVPDLTFSNFMSRVGQLVIAGYETAPTEAGLRVLIRLDYADRNDSPLGFLELVRGDAQTDAYYLRSEQTRVLATAATAMAQRVEGDLTDVFIEGPR